MRLIKGRKTKREEPGTEDRFLFPAVQETWEISCASEEEWEGQCGGKKEADRPGVARRFNGSAVA